MPGRINVSETVAGHVKNLFELESRGSIESKHERTHQMLFLNRLKPESSGNRDASAPNENFAAEYNRLTGFRMTPPVVPSFRGTTKSRARNS